MTPEEAKYLALALDALESVKFWPENAQSWWRVTTSALRAGEGKARVAQAVAQYQLKSAEARWFRHSALHALTGEYEHTLQMGRLATELPDPERWMTFSTLVWWEALTLSGDRTAFRNAFIETGLPKLLGILGKQLAAGGGERTVPEGLRRVAIVAQHLSNGRQAPTALTFDLRAVLEAAGVATRVFCAQELAQPTMPGFSASAQASDLPPADPSTWRLRLPGEASVTFADPRFSLQARWKSMAQQIAGFAPDAVLFVGFWSPLVWWIRERFPLVGMSTHSVPPLSPVDVWLAADTGSDLHWPGLPPPQNHLFPFRFWPSKPSQAVARPAIGVPDDAVLLVTTGNRLPTEMTPAWCALITSVMEQHPGSHWLLVGLLAKDQAQFCTLHPRIRVLDSQEDLAAWIALCDIYLNPPRVGGGASVAIAMDLGVPVVSLSGSDGGDKVGDLAVSTAEGFRERVRQWLGDAALRRAAGEQLQARFRSRLDLSGPQAAQGLLQAFELAQASFARRQQQRVAT